MTDELCGECGFDPGAVTEEDIPEALRRSIQELANVVRDIRPLHVDARISTESWSVMEYVGHVRDVLVVQRERILHALVEDTPTVHSMSREQRVAIGEYDGYEPGVAATDVERAGRWLLHTLQGLDRASWNRGMVYQYPETSVRTVRWLAAHTIHEVVHHTQDVRAYLQ